MKTVYLTVAVTIPDSTTEKEFINGVDYIFTFDDTDIDAQIIVCDIED